MNMAMAIYSLVRGASYRGNVDGSTREQFDAIEWCDTRPKPSWDDVLAEMSRDAGRYDPDRLILAVDAMGRTAELEAILAAASPRIRLRWQKATTFAGDDPDFVSMLDAICSAWELTPEQRMLILSECSIGTQ